MSNTFFHGGRRSLLPLSYGPAKNCIQLYCNAVVAAIGVNLSFSNSLLKSPTHIFYKKTLTNKGGINK